MPSKIIGRAKCPECDFAKAHVKESEKGTVYRYCPECSAQYFPRGQVQQQRLRDSMSATPTGSGANGPAPAPTEPKPTAPAPVQTPKQTAPVPPAPAPRRGLGIF